MTELVEGGAPAPTPQENLFKFDTTAGVSVRDLARASVYPTEVELKKRLREVGKEIDSIDESISENNSEINRLLSDAAKKWSEEVIRPMAAARFNKSVDDESLHVSGVISEHWDTKDQIYTFRCEVTSKPQELKPKESERLLKEGGVLCVEPPVRITFSQRIDGLSIEGLQSARETAKVLSDYHNELHDLKRKITEGLASLPAEVELRTNAAVLSTVSRMSGGQSMVEEMELHRIAAVSAATEAQMPEKPKALTG